jgi:hypothetical protein
MKNLTAWSVGAYVLALIVAASIVFQGHALGAVRFKPFDLGAFPTTLAPLLVIATLIERTIEVIFGIWREPGDRAAETRVKAARSEAVAQSALAQAAVAASAPAAPTAVAAATAAQTSAADAQLELGERKVVNTRLAFALAFSFGVLVALAGVRVLQILIMDTQPAWPKNVAPQWWEFIDIVLTAGLLGGGADGFHHVTQVISEFLRASQERAKQQANTPTA